jgi:hypothetical protein
MYSKAFNNGRRRLKKEWVKEFFIISFSIKTPKGTLYGHLKWGLIVL